jgi:EAL domain-containing protein (putative c-di-GMP-specific phosphodiesterase class I)/CheY-like chemotaxis protein
MQPTECILVVDDDEVVRVMLDELLSAAGFRPTVVPDAREALSRLGNGVPWSAVVTDLFMPEMTGIDLLREIRAGGNKRLPVVLLTGSPTLETAMAAVGDARVRYITKADAADTLIPAVRELLQLLTLPPSPPGSEPRHPHVAAAEQGGADFDAALDQLWIAFQPIVSWREKAAFGYEALVRSKHAVLSNPGRLFEAAERLERLPEIGRRIRHLVAHEIAQAPPEARIFVNLHSSDLNDEQLYASDARLSSYADRVVYEVTERASLHIVKDLPGRLRALRSAGFRIAVDDLGAGYAGLASFGQLDPEVVKLDMSLIRDIDKQPRLQRLVQSMLTACAGEAEILVVCEGVETAEERDCLVELGADLLQGYFFGRPGPGFAPAVL